MKKTILAGIMATMFVSASYANDIVEVPITNVKPNYVVTEVRVPVNNCNQQLVPTHRNGGGFTANNIIGGVIGGILGNQFGKGDGRTATTAIGAVTGAVVAGNQFNSSDTHYEKRVVCNTYTKYRTQQKTFVDGYLVSYTFNGLNYTTRTAFKPYGNTLKLRVSHSVLQ